MIHIQVIARDGTSLRVPIRRAIESGAIRSFEISQIKGGMRIVHKKHPGQIGFSASNGPLLATLRCNNRQREWQLLEAFVGRLAYHFRSEIAAINIQPGPVEND